MKLAALTAKPQLMLVKIDDEETISQYNEPLEFYTWDRQPLDVFMKLASAQQSDASGIIEIIRTLVLDENGNPILSNENMLPTNITMKAITKVTEMLGK
jgi:hypothetical protein